jgi:undecaprenyl diphosphate synthase
VDHITQELLSQLDPEKTPTHVAIIMDGNGRWAKERGEDRIYGHLNGVTSVRETLKGAREAGVKYLTLYAFSTENWNRPAEEVSALMDLLVSTILKELDELQENQVRLNAIGNLESLPGNCYGALTDAIGQTSDNQGITLTLALSYGSRWEMVKAVKGIAEKVANHELRHADINEETLSNHLSTAGMPDPELLIRTSGEQRISNFLLWQIAYAELYFTDVHWPDFRKQHLFQALVDHQKRERRFGKTSEQLST